MHSKHGKGGLEIVSVTLDDPRDRDAAKTRERVIRFLNEKIKPTFPSVNLDIRAEDREKKFKTGSVPIVYVFNRDNRYVMKLPLVNDKGEEEEVDYDAIEKAVANLIKK
jgi:hypothetical protein